MNIIFDNGDISELKNNNILLELDTFYFSSLNKTATAYTVIENVNIVEFGKVPQIQKLHAELIQAYKSKNFKLCQDLIDVLRGAFNGEIDSFYQDLAHRIVQLSNQQILDNWTGVLIKD